MVCGVMLALPSYHGGISQPTALEEEIICSVVTLNHPNVDKRRRENTHFIMGR
jgi:hypothetical protein